CPTALSCSGRHKRRAQPCRGVADARGRFVEDLTRGPCMRFGLFGGAAAPRSPDVAASARGFFDFVETNVEAEALGYHSSFGADPHVAAICEVSATLTLLTFIAAGTTRLRLGTAILVLPWHNPVLLAEQV